MSTKDFESLRNVHKGRMDWKIKVRVIREWRGVTTTGIVFKSVNYLLLDNKNCRMQDLVPAALVERFSRLIVEGNVYFIKNFQVKDYTDADKYRPVQMDKQIIFTADSKVKEVDQTTIFIPKNSFDLFEYGDLKPMTKQVLYLTGSLPPRCDSIIEKIPTISRVPNKQVKIKFKITNGRKRINVTFWSSFAEDFEKAVHENWEEPIIIIISSGRITSWNDQLDICNYSPTRFYLNYDHHSVSKLRKMMKDPNFSNHQFARRKKPIQVCTVEEIKNLGADYCEEEVACKATIKLVEQNQMWNRNICSSCYSDTEFINNDCFCKHCKRNVAQTLKRFNLSTIVHDSTGELQLIIEDRDIRILIGKRVEEVETVDNSFPHDLINLQGKNYTFKILIQTENVDKRRQDYVSNGIIHGWEYEHIAEEAKPTPQMTNSFTTQTSGTSYHLDEISQLEFPTN